MGIFNLFIYAETLPGVMPASKFVYDLDERCGLDLEPRCDHSFCLAQRAALLLGDASDPTAGEWMLAIAQPVSVLLVLSTRYAVATVSDALISEELAIAHGRLQAEAIIRTLELAGPLSKIPEGNSTSAVGL